MAIPIGNSGRARDRKGWRGSPRLDEEQEERAQQLERVGRARYAERIRACGLPEGVLQFRWCGLRCCPRCAVRMALANATKAHAVLIRMRAPVAVVLTLPSRNLRDLDRTMSALAVALRRLRAHALELGITRFIAGIHPKLANSGRLWSVHAHAAFDGSAGAYAALEDAWRTLTRGRGAVVRDPYRLRVGDLEAYARYVTDEKDWNPPAAAIRDDLLDVLIDGIRHRRLVLRWGLRRRRKVWRVVARSAA